MSFHCLKPSSVFLTQNKSQLLIRAFEPHVVWPLASSWSQLTSRSGTHHPPATLTLILREIVSFLTPALRPLPFLFLLPEILFPPFWLGLRCSCPASVQMPPSKRSFLLSTASKWTAGKFCDRFWPGFKEHTEFSYLRGEKSPDSTT